MIPILQMRNLESRKSLEFAQVHTVGMDRAVNSLPSHPALEEVPGHSPRAEERWK